MRILRLCIDIPYPPTEGTRIEPFHTNRYLAEAGHEITLVAFQWRPTDTAPVRRYCDLHTFPFDGRNKPLKLLQGALQGFPVNYVKYRRRDVLAHCLRLLDQRSHDVVLVDYGAMGWVALRLKQRMGIPLVTRWYNLDTLIWRRWCGAQASALKRFLGRRQVASMAQFEAQLACASDICMVMGAGDAVLLQQLAPTARVRYLPHGVDTGHYAPRDSSLQESESVLFLASNYRWHPNLDAARRLVTEVMPRVWRARSKARVYLTGDDVIPEMRAWDSAGRVVFAGFVPDERELLARTAVVVIPMRLGGGIKLKLLSALSMAKAVVTTPEGAEGLAGLVDGEHLLIRDTDAGFADAILELMADPQRRATLGTNGRALVQRHCDWPVIGRELETALSEVVQAQRPRKPSLDTSRPELANAVNEGKP